MEKVLTHSYLCEVETTEATSCFSLTSNNQKLKTVLFGSGLSFYSSPLTGEGKGEGDRFIHRSPDPNHQPLPYLAAPSQRRVRICE